jgi:hypothetical protein
MRYWPLVKNKEQFSFPFSPEKGWKGKKPQSLAKFIKKWEKEFNRSLLGLKPVIREDSKTDVSQT